MHILIGFLIGTVSLQSQIISSLADEPVTSADETLLSAEESFALEAETSRLADESSSSCACHFIYKPVCGTNDVTYSNKCVLDCVNKDNVANGRPIIKIAYPGVCMKPKCQCPAVIKPICGSDGRTYINQCILDCYNKIRIKYGLPIIKKAYDGVCKTKPCNNIIIPVCGSDGRTYRNICYLQYASWLNQARGLPPIYWRHNGPCNPESCTCPLIYDPVCASDGKTYTNKCFLACENRRRRELGQPQLTIKHQGECREDCKCDRRWDPVCGSDGKTYGNICLLNCENLRRIKQGLPPLLVAYKGVCTDCFCPQYVDPVCGSDKKTYMNECYLWCENRRLAQQGLPPIYIVHRGPCKDPGCGCTKEYNPVCASDGRTYANPCLFRCENKRLKELGLPLIWIVHMGVCDRCNCPNIYDPVCATDGRWMWTFRSLCWLDCENWKRKNQGLPPLRLLHRGVCQNCQCNCNYILQPVCGSDKRTYRNICWLLCTSRCNVERGLPPIQFISNGYC